MTKKRTDTKKHKKRKLWGLISYVFPKPVREYIDQNYINKLNDEEKEWLSKFNEEYYGNTIRDGAHHYNKAKTKDKRTKEYKEEIKTIKRELYTQTNQRNRDIYNKGPKFGFGANTLKDYGSNEVEQYNLETNLIELIDYKKLVDAIDYKNQPVKKDKEEDD